MNTEVEFLKKNAQEFVDERDWQQFHSPKNLSMSIAIKAAELMELFQWQTIDESTSATGELRDKIREELADVIVYCLSFGNAAGIDITSSVLEKMDKNCRKYPVDRYKGRF